jgi:hypothetical protein
MVLLSVLAQVSQAARHFLRAPRVRERAQAIARQLFGDEPFMAVHLRREATEIGCAHGAPSVLCPKPGPEYTLDTRQVLNKMRRAQQQLGVRHVFVATIYPAQHPQYERELPQLLGALPGAQSLSDLSKMTAALGQPGRSLELTRYEQSLVEQELCAIAHGFLGSGRSTWTGNVELQRASFNRPSMMFGQLG